MLYLAMSAPSVGITYMSSLAIANQEAKAGAKPAHRARNPLLVRLADAVLALYEDADAV